MLAPQEISATKSSDVTSSLTIDEVLKRISSIENVITELQSNVLELKIFVTDFLICPKTAIKFCP